MVALSSKAWHGWGKEMATANTSEPFSEWAPIRFPFNGAKAAEAAAVLLQTAGGKMPYMRLIKLVYLADRESLHRYGRPIVGGQYVAMKYGPVTSEVLDAIKRERSGPWQAMIERQGCDVKLRQEPKAALLSEAEISILRETADLFRQLDQWALSYVTHEVLPEWHDPGQSATEISPEEILRALQKSDEEIEQVREEAVEDAYFESLFSQGSAL